MIRAEWSNGMNMVRSARSPRMALLVSLGLAALWLLVMWPQDSAGVFVVEGKTPGTWEYLLYIRLVSTLVLVYNLCRQGALGYEPVQHQKLPADARLGFLARTLLVLALGLGNAVLWLPLMTMAGLASGVSFSFVLAMEVFVLAIWLGHGILLLFLTFVGPERTFLHHILFLSLVITVVMVTILFGLSSARIPALAEEPLVAGLLIAVPGMLKPSVGWLFALHVLVFVLAAGAGCALDALRRRKG